MTAQTVKSVHNTAPKGQIRPVRFDHHDFQEVHDGSPIGMLAIDNYGVITYVNPAEFNRLNLTEQEIIGKSFFNVYHDAKHNGINEAKLMCMEEILDQEFWVGDGQWALISSKVYRDKLDHILTYIYIRNVSRLKKEEDLFTYLTKAAAELAKPRNTHDALDQISHHIVPRFANWFTIDILKDNHLELLVMRHEDPGMIRWAHEFRKTYPTDLKSDNGPGPVIRTGKPTFIPMVTDDMIKASVSDPGQLEAIRMLGIQSAITVAMSNKDKITGVITFISTTPGRHYDESDLNFSQNFANLIGLALENTRLNEEAAREINQRIQMAEQLAESEKLFRFLADAIPHKMWTADPDGRATYYNRGWYDYTHIYDFDSLRNRVWDFIHPDDRAQAAEQWPRAMKTGEEVDIEQRLLRYDGVYRWHLSKYSAHRNEEGQINMWVGTSTDIHEQKIAQDALKVSEAHFRALTNDNSLPIWQINTDGKLTFVNDTWRAWTGVSAEQVSIENASGRLHPDDLESATREFDVLFKQKLPVQVKYRFKNEMLGEYRWVLDNAQPVFNPEFDGYIGTMTDIHDEEQDRLAIQLSMKKKDEFMAIASHELKTPITSMKASLQLLEKISSDNFDPKKAQPFIGMANKQVNKLTAIVGDLLDITKIQLGKMQLNKTHYTFQDSLSECVREVAHYEKNYEILINASQPVTVFADKERVEQVIVNLLSNAIKYSPDEKTIQVHVEAGEKELKCAVIDAGIGIPADKQPFIFDRFFRVHDSSQNFAGLGLGLYISSEIITQHQGEIGLISEEGKGSTFWFTLPLSAK
jgi:PAS domain S-box-containing protein